MRSSIDMSHFLGVAAEKVLDFRLAFLLISCVVLGGTSQSITTFKAPLYLISLAFIAWVVLSKSSRSLNNVLSGSMLLFASLPLLYCLYLIPLPPAIWSSLTGREIIVEGYKLIDVPLPWMPLSLAPEQTFLSLFAFIPPIAVGLVVILSSNQREVKNGLFALLGVTVFAAILGLLQMAVGGDSLWLYEISNVGRPLGFFANTNHLAGLCACLLPISILYVSRSGYGSSVARDRAGAIVSLIVLIMTILLTGSSSGYLLLFIGLTLSSLFLFQARGMKSLALILWSLIVLVLIVDFFFLSGELLLLLNKLSSESATSRTEIFSKTYEMIRGGSLVGHGPGSFVEIYKMFENETTIDRVFVNEAHNDYLQIVFEFGVFGFILLILFLAWIAHNTIYFLRSDSPELKQCYLILIGLIILALLSLVDYPLRTITLSTVGTFMVCFIVRKKQLLNK